VWVQNVFMEVVAPLAFRHEALLYSGDEGFLAGTLPFIDSALRADEPIMVVVESNKIEQLRGALGGDSGRVRFEDMASVGRNPARILPAWQDFVDEQIALDRPFRGVGESIWAGRNADEVVECQRHETLLNVAFAAGPPWWLLCPYDTEALPPDVIEKAQLTHPVVTAQGDSDQSGGAYPWPPLNDRGPFDGSLSPPPADAEFLEFRTWDLTDLRVAVAHAAAGSGVDPERAHDVVVAVNELATNSLRHGGGRGTLRMWSKPGEMVCEVEDRGRIDSPLAGQTRPGRVQRGGRGLWLVNQLCDLVQVRSSPTGTVVRVHISVP